MKLTITISGEDTKKYDIQVDNRQRIITTLRVLSENMGEFAKFARTEWVSLKESGRRIPIDKTYEDAGVYTGAWLVVHTKETDGQERN